MLTSFPPGGLAVVIGATGSIGAALMAALKLDGTFAQVIGMSRSSIPALDLLDEASIAVAALNVASLGMDLRLVIDATGELHSQGFMPEKSWQKIDPEHMARSFAINAIGPALLMKHFLPLLSATGPSVLATLSAKVGSIGDNRLGGWYSYRASKAALNQLVRTAAIELQRRQAHALCVALHPGTVHSDLSAPFAKTGLSVVTPQAGVHVYVCGPKGFMDAVLSIARGLGWPEPQLHCEYFAGETAHPVDADSFEVQLASSGRVVRVPSDQTVVQALAACGIELQTSCEQGVCGTCLTRVLEGVPDHKDLYLTPEEQAANDQFLPCCSRAKSARLVLDL